MKKIICLIFICFFSFEIYCQVKVNAADNGQYSIENLARFFVGRGVSISNVTFIGNKEAFGKFSDATGSIGSDGTGSIGLKKGIVLTTGKAKDAEGPNNIYDLSHEWLDKKFVTDFDLNNLGSTSDITTDIAILEFDFVPLTNNIGFRAVYASDEYDIRIDNSTFNWDDPFAVFLSEKDGLTKNNIATFSGINGSQYISIRNINFGFEAKWGKPPVGPGVNGDFYIYNTTFSPNTQYNGYTKVLNFNSTVNKCETYHLKIAIGDSKLGNFDSGVFIEPGDFGEKAIVSSVPKSLSDTIFLCKGDILPILSVDGTNTANLQWYYNDNLIHNSITVSFPVTLSGEYKVMATVSGNCTWSDSVYVQIGQKFPLDLITSHPLVCMQQLVTLSGIVPNTVSGLRIDWYSADNLPFTESAFTQILTITSRNALSPIFISVRDASGCIQKDSVTVTVNPAFFNIEPLVPDTICLNQAAPLLEFVSAKPALETDPFQKTWRNGANQVINLPYYPRKSDTYQFSILSKNGCKDSASVFIQVDSVAYTKLSNKSICIGQATTLSTSGSNVKWTQIGKVGTLSTKNLIDISPVSTTGYTLQAEGFSPLSCISRDTAFVIVNPLPAYQKSNDTTVCKAQNVFISVQNVENIAWTNSTLSGKSFIYNPLKPIALKFTASTTNNCSKSDSIKIGLFSDYVNTLVGISKICKGENITIMAINSKTNFWVNTNETTAKVVANPPNSTIYTFVGSNINQCKDTSFFPIVVNKVPIDDVDFLKSSQNGYLCPEKSLFDTLSGPSNAKFTYNWSLDSKSIINNFNFFHVNKTGVYKLTITDSAGCKLSDTLLVTKKCDTIVIIPPAPIITIPNIFTPNN
ncbi:MAG: choice-of-anchor L domain-containing protein, partial [Cytophagales bacterium]